MEHRIEYVKESRGATLVIPPYVLSAVFDRRNSAPACFDGIDPEILDGSKQVGIGGAKTVVEALAMLVAEDAYAVGTAEARRRTVASSIDMREPDGLYVVGALSVVASKSANIRKAHASPLDFAVSQGAATAFEKMIETRSALDVVRVSVPPYDESVYRFPRSLLTQ